MRIHVALPVPTTVSVDDDLIALLGAVLVLERPALHASAKEQLSSARRFVRQVAARCGIQTTGGLSRTIQQAIFRRIAHPQALAILDARDTEEAQAKAAAAHLEECAKNGWLTPDQIAEKRRIKALRTEWRKRKSAARAASQVAT